MKKSKKVLLLILATLFIVGLLAGCSNSTKTASKPSTSKPVKLVYYLWGSAGVANQAILDKINAKLKKDINATLDIKYIDWADVSTKYPLLFASGEQFDMSHASPNADISYFTLASQGALTDITDMLGTAVPKLKAAIPAKTWDGTKYKGKIYGVPSLYSEFTPSGYAYRTDLLKKYKLKPINSIPSMEAYMDAVVKNEKFAPLNSNSGESQNMYTMMVDLTGGWIEAPGINSDQLDLVATSPTSYRNIIDPAFTQQFEDWAVMMHSWAEKGYFEKDILSSQNNDKTNMDNGQSGGMITSMVDWTGNYGTLLQNLPKATTDFWAFPALDKIKKTMGVENTTIISNNSKNPERALMAIEKLMTDKSYYDLMQYGIEGKQYQIVGGKVTTPAKYNVATDLGGFSAWALRNDKFNIPAVSEDPRRYELIDQWNKTAINNPYMGFSFDPTNVSSEISAISDINSKLGVQLMLGKTPNDPKIAVQQYREQLKKAGIDKVIAEVDRQLAKFTPIN